MSVHREGSLSQHELQVVSQHALQWGGAGLGGGMVPGLGGVCSWGGLLLGGVHSWGVSGGDPPKLPGPQPGGKLGGSDPGP